MLPLKYLSVSHRVKSPKMIYDQAGESPTHKPISTFGESRGTVTNKQRLLNFIIPSSKSGKMVPHKLMVSTLPHVQHASEAGASDKVCRDPKLHLHAFRLGPVPAAASLHRMPPSL